MDFRFTEEQEAFRLEVRNFLEEEIKKLSGVQSVTVVDVRRAIG